MHSNVGSKFQFFFNFMLVIQIGSMFQNLKCYGVVELVGATVTACLWTSDSAGGRIFMHYVVVVVVVVVVVNLGMNEVLCPDITQFISLYNNDRPKAVFMYNNWLFNEK